MVSSFNKVVTLALATCILASQPDPQAIEACQDSDDTCALQRGISEHTVIMNQGIVPAVAPELTAEDEAEDEVIGYWGFNFGPGSPASAPAATHTNNWICFKGTSELTPESTEQCHPKITGSPKPWTNIGGGGSPPLKNSITKENLGKVSTLAPNISKGGFKGVSFDMEALSGWKTYEDFEKDFLWAIGNCTKHNLKTLLTTSKNGKDIKTLQTTWPGGWDTKSWNKFTENVVPKFDYYSPQCYSHGKETGPADKICSATWAHYSSYKHAKAIVPSVSGEWVKQNGGENPTKTLRRATFWPPNVPIVGYMVWDPQ